MKRKKIIPKAKPSGAPPSVFVSATSELPKAKFSLNPKLLIIPGILIIAVYYLIFEKFFPNSFGSLGEDYSLGMPQLLDGVFWYKMNGLFQVPWFTPSFGGGLPNFPNPQSIYYSAPQFLCFIFDPVLSMKLTLVLFGAIGFYGCYLFLRKIFFVSPVVAMLGATLFLFNSYFSSRMIIGHIPFHAYMLIPLFLFFIFQERNNGAGVNYKGLLMDVGGGAFIIAYMFYAGALQLIAPFMLVIFTIAVINKLLNDSFRVGFLVLKVILVLILGGALAAAKINASMSFLKLFPRDLYSLPGVSDFSALFWLFFNSLFGAPDADYANSITVNRAFVFMQYEYEYGVGIIPLLVITTGLFFLAYKLFTGKYLNKIRAKMIWLLALLVLLAIPLLLNYYTPSWNAFLKTWPLIKNSSQNIRWCSVYILVLILLTCLVIEKVGYLNKYKYQVAIFSMLFVVFINATQERTYYENQHYDPGIIVSAYHNIEDGKAKPEITAVNSEVSTENGTIYRGNNLIALGYSQLYPYEPMFGYWLENYPKRPLRAGPVMQEVSGGVLNMKNPAGYVFPSENNCFPGGHFTISQKESAEKFRHYSSFPFVISSKQKIANFITIVSLCALVIYSLYYCFIKVYKGKSNLAK